MSIHSSLRISGALQGSRNVFKRVERLMILKEQERWDESQSVYGLPKVRTRFKTATGKKKKEKKEEAEVQEEAAKDTKDAKDAKETKAKGG